jgi:glutathione S-transferase
MAEKGIEIETVQVSLGDGEQFSESFRTLNPDCGVPVLELDDGSAITEVVAICSYLESLQPEPALMGTTAAERASVLMWNCIVEQQGLYAIMDGFRNFSKGMIDRALPGPVSYAQIPALSERGRARTEHFFARLDAQLSTNEYVAGASFSFADITAMISVDFAARIKLSLPDDAANARRWYELVSARPGANA